MDATLTVNRIIYRLDQTFGSLIDMGDVANESTEKQRTKFLSRSLAAFCIQALTDADPKQAAASITDSYHDQGIDAIHIDVVAKTLCIVQAKWTKMPDQGDIEKFLSGVNALMRPNFSGFDSKIKARESEIRSFLMRSDFRVVLLVAYCNSQDLGSEAKSPVDSFVELNNNVGDAEVFSFESFGLARIYKALSGSPEGKIDLEIVLREWGTLADPYRAYYGQILLSDVASWVQHDKALFHKNLRFYSSGTEVNEAIEKTAIEASQHFWYFNNGITVLCNSIKKKLINTDNRDYGAFDCYGASVINGAQTVGVIWDVAKKTNGYLASSKSRVSVRILSLEGTPEGFASDVTRAANTQNRIQNRDFASLDPLQHHLANEMMLDQKRYAFKSGDPDPRGEDGCNIEESTVALACAHGNLDIAMTAKREVGQLWKDIKKPPYTLLFHPKLTSRIMWRAVKILREVESELAKVDPTVPRGEFIAVHGSRFILRRVFLDPEMPNYRDPAVSDPEILTYARKSTQECLRNLASIIERKYPQAYLANLFKNFQKCEDLDEELTNSPANMQFELFQEALGDPQ